MKKFINDFNHKIKSRINWFHELCKQPLNSVDSPGIDTPYQIVSRWFLDIVSYGFIITFIWNGWFGWQGWNNIMLLFGNGFAMWMVKEFIKTVKEGITEQ